MKCEWISGSNVLKTLVNYIFINIKKYLKSGFRSIHFTIEKEKLKYDFFHIMSKRYWYNFRIPYHRFSCDET